MSWYYADGGQQKGPLADAEFDSLIQSGVIRLDTLVWKESMAGWKKLAEVRAGAGAPPPGAPPVQGGLLCAECGKSFAADQVVRVNDRWVCAACKPVFLQRVREGTVGRGAVVFAGTVPEEEVSARDYEHDVGAYCSRAWEFFKADPWPLIGATVLIYLCIGLAGAAPFGIGFILSLVFTGPLMGGLCYYYLRKLRGQEASLSDAFSGFGPHFKQWMLAKMIPTLLAMLCFIPVLIVIGIGAALLIPAMKSGGGASPAVMIPVFVVGGLLALAAICVAVYFQTCWIYALWLVVDKEMTFWPAMTLSRKVVIKHWWMNFLVTFVAGLIASAGMLACLVGVLVTGPMAFAMIGMAYERLFGDMQPARV